MAATADEIRVKILATEDDWTDAVLEGKVFIGAGDAWLTDRLTAGGLTYFELTADRQLIADNAEISWVASKVCMTEALRAAAAGSSFKAGPVSITGSKPADWRAMGTALLDEAGVYLGMIGGWLEDRASGFEFVGGTFGDETDDDYYTIPNSLVFFDKDHSPKTPPANPFDFD